jgi:ABC-type bacteriocin/lantibiotic exporter with double-glycine peptidase domain
LSEESLDTTYDRTYFSRYLELFSIQKNLSSLLIDILEFVLIVGSGMLIVALYHPAFLVFDILLIFSLVFVVKIVGKDGIETKLEESETKYDLAAWIMSLSRPAVALRGLNGIELAEERTQTLANNFIQTRKSHFRILFRQQAGFLLISVLSSTALLGAGGILVFNNQLSLGQLVAAEIILAGVLASIGKLDKIMENYFTIISSVSKLESLFAIPVESVNSSGHQPARLSGKIELQNLNYRYPGGTPLWKPIRVTIPKGAMVAIMGPSGSGKSTLLELLYGLRNPSEGTILFDDFHLKDLHLKKVRDYIGFASIFQAIPGTLKTNILLGREVDFAELTALAKDLALEDAIAALPNGYSTEIEPVALPFSVGQKARLSLLRAMIHKPEILIVDESLDQIDTDLQDRVLDTIAKKMNGKTILIATHDEQIAKRCTQRIELKMRMITGGES